jgi:adenine-specific DNA-methyltransferase
VGQHSTAQHSTAQHSTAQHSTAQHSINASQLFMPHEGLHLHNRCQAVGCAAGCSDNVIHVRLVGILWGSTAPHRTAPHRTAPHRTAQHSIHACQLFMPHEGRHLHNRCQAVGCAAGCSDNVVFVRFVGILWHSTAQHSTAQHSTAQHAMSACTFRFQLCGPHHIRHLGILCGTTEQHRKHDTLISDLKA